MLIFLCDALGSKPTKVINYLIAKEFDTISKFAESNKRNYKDISELRELVKRECVPND